MYTTNRTDHTHETAFYLTKLLVTDKSMNNPHQSLDRIFQLDQRISGLQNKRNAILNAGEKLDLDQRLLVAQLGKEIDQWKIFLHFVVQGYRIPFYFYVLPSEMLRSIFQYIEDPQDKLRLLGLFPELSHLMNWNKIAICFEITFPDIYPYICGDWRNLFNLCQASQTIQEIVLQYFGNILPSRNHYQHNWNPIQNGLVPLENIDQDIDQIIDEIENTNMTDCPWVQNMPFLFGFRYETNTQTFQERRESILRFLDDYGHRFWAGYLCIEVLNENPPGQLLQMQLANDFLALENSILDRTPNLRYLTDFMWPDHFQVFQQAQNHMWRFPQLPHLKQLSVELPPIPPMNGVVSLPNLETCNISSQQVGVETVLQNYLWTSPLKIAKLNIEPNFAPTRITTLFILLNHYGNTLERLSITFDPLHANVEDENGDDVPNEEYLMLDIHLPKLKYFELTGYRGCLGFLLAFLGLESLKLNDCKMDGTDFSQDLLHIPWIDARKYDTYIWKYMANLRYLFVQVYTDNAYGFRFGPRREARFSVTREEHEKYHSSKNSNSDHKTFLGSVLSLLPMNN